MALSDPQDSLETGARMGKVIVRTEGSGVWSNSSLHVMDVRFLDGKDINRKKEWLTTATLYLSYLYSSALGSFCIYY